MVTSFLLLANEPYSGEKKEERKFDFVTLLSVLLILYILHVMYHRTLYGVGTLKN